MLLFIGLHFSIYIISKIFCNYRFSGLDSLILVLLNRFLNTKAVFKNEHYCIIPWQWKK